MDTALSKTVDMYLHELDYPTDISTNANSIAWEHEMIKAFKQVMRKEMLAYGT